MLFNDDPQDHHLAPQELTDVLSAAPELELHPEPLVLPDQPDPPLVELFSDGGASPNPGPGGWAFVLRHGSPDGVGNEVEGAGAVPSTTNNRMELTAAIRGLAHLDRACRVRLVSDSEYLLKGLSEWLSGWKRRNWVNSRRKPVLNSDLWKILDRLAGYHQISGEWTKGHAGHPENERCDQLVCRLRDEHFGA